MWCNGDDGNFFFVRAIEPENPVGGRCLILSIGLKNFFTIRADQCAVFMGIEAGVTGIGLKVAERLAHGLQALEEALVLLK